MITTHITDNRETVLHVLRSELQERTVYSPAPDFSCTTGDYTLHRDGTLTVDADHHRIFPLLASLGLCDFPVTPEKPEDNSIVYPTASHSGKTLLNLFSILSSRQLLLNRALNAGNAFFVQPTLMGTLLAHPPATVSEFLQTLYGRNQEYGGIRVSASFITFTGFRLCPKEEEPIHRQLADRIIHASLALSRVKPYTRNVRNKKYAFRTWMNAIGMTGSEYEDARHILLDRLYGQSDRRALRR